MEAMAYTFNREDLPRFPRFLHLLTQDVDGRSFSRKEFAHRLTRSGFETSDANVSQWMNEERTPPPGLPYYTSIALELSDEQSRDLSWSYTVTYKDKRKRVKKKAVPDRSAPTEDQLDDIQNLKEAQDRADEAAREGNSHESKSSDA